MIKPHISVAEVVLKLKTLPPDAEVTGIVIRPLEAAGDGNAYLGIIFCRKDNVTEKTSFLYTFSKEDREKSNY